MKIKEVMEQTGLTDRAIRLYIENELVKPDCDVSYNGRKKIDFSEEDVKQLKNIATLRKADFTIAEIKWIMEGGEASKQALQGFIKNTTEIFEKNRLILKSLEPLADEDNITVELICSHLDNAVAEEPVPVSDMKMNFLEKRENIFYLCWSAVGIIVYVAFFAVFSNHYLYPSAAEDFWTMVKWLIILQLPFISPMLLFVLRIIRTFIKKIEIEAISIILSIITLFSMMTTPFFAFISGWVSPCLQSCTENPDNYLKVDEYVQIFSGDDLSEYFPTFIPVSAKKDSLTLFSSDYEDTTKYHYRYRSMIDPDFEIFAEWKLSKYDYKAEKERMLSMKGETTGKRQKGDWTCIYYEDYYEPTKQSSYYYIIFAYNDKTKTVRYIMCYCIDTAEDTYQPYYYSLKW